MSLRVGGGNGVANPPRPPPLAGTVTLTIDAKTTVVRCSRDSSMGSTNPIQIPKCVPILVMQMFDIAC